MKNKVTIAVSLAILSAGACAADSTRFDWKNKSELQIIKSSALSKSSEKSQLETYIVRLKDEPLATYKGGIKGLSATSPELINHSVKSAKNSKLDMQSLAAKKYQQHLDGQRQTFIQGAKAMLARTPEVLFTYDTVFNGVALKLTKEEAFALVKLPNVAEVQKDFNRKPLTDRGPARINADKAWDGTATGVSAMGEGMVIGIIDTGINHDSPSFSAVDSVSGYTHVNPLGEGTYLGDCATTEGLCNSKLIGSYNFLEASDTAEDENSHGSHVASTAGGNNVRLADGDSWNMSGVAPRANIINYKACCEGAALMAAIEQAVEDGVDVINYSIGASNPYINPWTNGDSMGFKAAKAAGVFVAVAAGNDGNGAITVGAPANSPWLTSVAASTHDRGNAVKSIGEFTGGDTTAPTSINGQSFTGAITASIVYAGNYTNGDDNPEQCLNAFPADTFSGQIVVCDRGEIARVDKAINVAAGGAGGFVLANVDGGATSLANDVYTIPGIHIASEDGDALKAWIASGADHMATISAGTFFPDESAADHIASFSSRGPNGYPADILAPGLTAPGVNILAAVAGDANNTGFLSGTSMASPHVAGAGALIKQLRPTWTPGQIHSALATTAMTVMKKEDGETAADMFDMGGGRIDVAAAANSGLLMDESDENFSAADPTLGGEPSTLNLPAMVQSECMESCSWSRTFTAAVDGSWTTSVEAEDGMTLTVSPTSFELTAGESVTLSITSEVDSAHGAWLKGSLSLTPSDSSVSTNRLPIASKVALVGNFPNEIELFSNTDDFTATISGVTAVNGLSMQGTLTQESAGAGGDAVTVTFEDSLAQDPTNNDPFDDLTQVNIHSVTVEEGTELVQFKTYESESPDLDLFVFYDKNDDGVPDYSADDQDVNELVGVAQSASAEEVIELTDPVAGGYLIVVQNWQASSDGAEDNYKLDFISGSLAEEVTINVNYTVPADISVDNAVDIAVSVEGAVGPGTRWMGTVELSNEAGVLTTHDVTLYRGENAPTVSMATSSQAGVAQTVSVDFDAPTTSTPYAVTVTVPSELSIVADSATNDAVIDGSTISWLGSVTEASSFTFDVNSNAANVGDTVSISATYETVSYYEYIQYPGYFFGVGFEGSQSADMAITASASIAGLADIELLKAGQTADVSFSISDTLAGDNVVTITSSHADVTITGLTSDASGGSFTLNADKKVATQDVTITVTVTDSENSNDTTSSSFTVSTKKKKSSGSTELFILAGLLLVGLRRRRLV
jgi:subtilisin family serine protease